MIKNSQSIDKAILSLFKNGNTMGEDDLLNKLQLLPECNFGCLNEKKETPLLMAIKDGCFRVASYLIKKMNPEELSKVDNNGISPLHEVIKYTDDYSSESSDKREVRQLADMALLLLSHGADPDIDSKLSSIECVDSPIARVYLLVLDKNKELILNGWRNVLMSFAQKSKNIDIVCDEEGNTLLSLAVEEGEKEIVMALVESGADLNFTPNDPDLSEPILLKSSCSVKSIESGLTPKWLISLGASNDAVNSNGDNLLNIILTTSSVNIGMNWGASKEETTQMILNALNDGVDPNQNNKQGNSPLDIAKSFKNNDWVSLIESFYLSESFDDKTVKTNKKQRLRL